jgi:hypothetical protein
MCICNLGFAISTAHKKRLPIGNPFCPKQTPIYYFMILPF